MSHHPIAPNIRADHGVPRRYRVHARIFKSPRPDCRSNHFRPESRASSNVRHSFTATAIYRFQWEVLDDAHIGHDNAQYGNSEDIRIDKAGRQVTQGDGIEKTCRRRQAWCSEGRHEATLDGA